MNLFETNTENEKNELPPDDAAEAAIPAQVAEPSELVLDIEGEKDETSAAEEPAQNVLKAETKALPKAAEIAGNLHAKLEEPAEDQAEAEQPEQPVNGVSYESVAKAVEQAKKEPTGRFNRDAVDDETLLAELYALIGDGSKPKAARNPEEPTSSRPVRPAARLTQEDLHTAPEVYEDVQEDDAGGVPGWLKGVFILLISLLLSAMTFYAVASDLLGKIF